MIEVVTLVFGEVKCYIVEVNGRQVGETYNTFKEAQDFSNTLRKQKQFSTESKSEFLKNRVGNLSDFTSEELLHEIGRRLHVKGEEQKRSRLKSLETKRAECVKILEEDNLQHYEKVNVTTRLESLESEIEKLRGFLGIE